jgi:hypothetical protein
MAKSNAAQVQDVSGLGDVAYWDDILRTLWVVKGRYWLSIETQREAGGLEAAKRIASTVLPRLQ